MTECCYCKCANTSHRSVLSEDERLEAAGMVQAKKSLRHPEIPGAVRGLEGMSIADKILKDYDATGILIGGLSEAVWYRKETDLSRHKDVDVLVVGDTAISRFEGGIDWWLQRNDRYVNGHDIGLLFSVRQKYELPAGLYIPDPDWIADMRMHEVEGGNDLARETFRDYLCKRMKDRLPDLLKDSFKVLYTWDKYSDTYWGICVCAINAHNPAVT